MSFNPLGLTLLNIPPLLRLSLGQSLGAALKNWSLSLSICSLMFSKGSASMLLCITPSLSGCLLLYMDTNAVLNLSPNLWTSLEHSRNSAHHWLTVICTGLGCYEASHWSADTLLHSDWMRDDSFCAEGSLWRHDGNIACARCSKITYFRSKLLWTRLKVNCWIGWQHDFGVLKTEMTVFGTPWFLEGVWNVICDEVRYVRAGLLQWCPFPYKRWH